MNLRWITPTIAMVCASIAAANAETEKCTPAVFELPGRVELRVINSTLSFELLVVGCDEELETLWPPSLELVVRALGEELREPHPVQTLMEIHSRSKDLRERITSRLNADVLGGQLVHDVVLLYARSVEDF